MRRNQCNMCYTDGVETTYVIEHVNGFQMLFSLCDDCLIRYSEKAKVKLDGHIHGYHIDDYDQFSEQEQKVIDAILESISLTRENWDSWRRITGDLKIKVLKIAAQICRMHGHVVGERVCQDWRGDTSILDSLTAEEKDKLQYIFEKHNSKGEDFQTDYFPYDEMLISYIIERALMNMVANEK